MNVEDDHIRLQVENRSDHVRPRRRLADHLMTEFLFDSILEEKANGGVILDDDDFQLLLGGRSRLHFRFLGGSLKALRQANQCLGQANLVPCVH